MSNFTIFNTQHVGALVEPFLPGATAHITPISFCAYTPDIFLFLFRTTSADNTDHYFVSVEYDYVEGEQDLRNIIKDWIGQEPDKLISVDGSEGAEEKDYIATLDSAYMCRLFHVPRPKNLMYWSSNIVVGKGDNVNKLLKDYTPAQRKHAKEVLQQGGPSRTISVFKRNNNMEIVYSD